MTYLTTFLQVPSKIGIGEQFTISDRDKQTAGWLPTLVFDPEFNTSFPTNDRAGNSPVVVKDGFSAPASTTLNGLPAFDLNDSATVVSQNAQIVDTFTDGFVWAFAMTNPGTGFILSFPGGYMTVQSNTRPSIHGWGSGIANSPIDTVQIGDPLCGVISYDPVTDVLSANFNETLISLASFSTRVGADPTKYSAGMGALSTAAGSKLAEYYILDRYPGVATIADIVDYLSGRYIP